MSVLTFDEQEQSRTVTNTSQDVLVFDAAYASRAIEDVGATEFLLFDTPAVERVVEVAPQDFLLIDPEPRPPTVQYAEDAERDVIVITGSGPTGPQGPPGEAGAGKNFVFVTAQSKWTCDHGFGRTPVDVTTIDSNGDEVFGDVYFVDDNRSRSAGSIR